MKQRQRMMSSNNNNTRNPIIKRCREGLHMSMVVWTHVDLTCFLTPSMTYTLRFTILRKWKEGNRCLATYRRLIQALFEAGAIDSIHNLCQELGAHHNPPACSTLLQTAQHSSQHPPESKGIQGCQSRFGSAEPILLV